VSPLLILGTRIPNSHFGIKQVGPVHLVAVVNMNRGSKTWPAIITMLRHSVYIVITLLFLWKNTWLFLSSNPECRPHSNYFWA